MKKVLTIVMIFVVSILCLPQTPRVAAAGQSFVKNRVVALVFDDSGSMKYARNPSTGQSMQIDNWKYANYSLQSLAGLLAPEDNLYVTRMSDPTKVEEIALSSDKRQGSIRSVQQWVDDGNTPTPFLSVQTAMKHLMDKAKANPDSEFWLVVLTDGVFNDFDPAEDNVADPEGNMKRAREQFLAYRQTMQSYNATTRSALVTIEQYLNEEDKRMMSSIKEMWQDALDAKVIESNGQQNIISKINEVAALITNRDPESGTAVSLHPVFTSNGIQFNSLFPIKRLTLLEQVVQNSAGVTIPNDQGKLTINQGGSTGTEGPYQIVTPKDKANLNPPILGQITQYRDLSDEGIMQDGEYRIEMKGADSRKDRVQLLAEPALDFRLAVYNRNPDGTLGQQENAFFFGSQMLAVVKLVKSNATNDPLDLLPATRKLVEVTGSLDDGNALAFQWDDELQAYTAPFDMPVKDFTKVNAQVRIKGFFQKEQSLEFRGHAPRKFGMESGQVEWSARVDKLEDAEPLRFIVTADGEPVGKEELAQILPSLKVDADGKKIHFDVKQEGSEILLQPRPHWNVWFTDAGEIPLTLTINGTFPNEQATVKYTATVQDVPWWYRWGLPILALVLLAVFLWWLIGMIRKPRFHRKSSYMSVTTRTLINGRAIGEYESTEPFRSKWWSRWLVPYWPEKSLIHDLTFEAGAKRDHIVLPKGSQSPGMIVAEEVLDEDAGRRDCRIYSNDEIIVRNGQMESVYKYCKN
ncbi:VWA domain-containing protein [Paenibacillus beijingensis]|uniref:VWFA domain-containing protein n=1 Tax=Paenibacillus beijingensis TaxID=1126833 RepID=A0A0D5NH76_9BACL|nr:VWA domain-containing protein [Paenibacillus beijingensis]AJY74268.1 hypothetical protein VN24_06340 [Paenibacillus beijingensis]